MDGVVPDAADRLRVHTASNHLVIGGLTQRDDRELILLCIHDRKQLRVSRSRSQPQTDLCERGERQDHLRLGDAGRWALVCHTTQRHFETGRHPCGEVNGWRH